MPVLPFEHPETGERREIYISPAETDRNLFWKQKIDGVIWSRIVEAPMMSVDSQIDPFSQKDFVDKTYNKKGTLGDIFDLSKELSEKRSKKTGGRDPVKQQFYKKWAEKHKGQVHHEKKKEDANEKLKPYGIQIK